MSAVSMTKKRKFVADGIFYAEVNEFFSRELGEDGALPPLVPPVLTHGAAPVQREGVERLTSGAHCCAICVAAQATLAWRCA
eukprot:scaffold463_cov351-Prasinococcus_capsulatus_cf.AAC.6